MVAVSKTGCKLDHNHVNGTDFLSFATRGWLWSTCGQGCRAEDLSEDPLRHTGMALRYLWAYSPCRRPARRPPSPRRDGTEVPVGMVPVPKTGQKFPFATR